MLNIVVLMGRLTKDPELRYTGSGTPVCSFNLAVNYGYGEKQRVDYINCVAWNKTAEFVSKYFSKGKMIALEGRIATRSWDGQNGKKRYVTEVVVQEASFAGDGKGDQGAAPAAQAASGADADGFTPLDMDESDLPWE